MHRLGSKLNRTVFNSVETPLSVAEKHVTFRRARFFCEQSHSHQKRSQKRKLTIFGNTKQVIQDYDTVFDNSIPFRKNDPLRILECSVPGLQAPRPVCRHQGRPSIIVIRPQKALQLETLLGGLGVPPAAGGKHSPRTSSLSAESHRAARNFCENLMVFRGLPRACWVLFFSKNSHMNQSVCSVYYQPNSSRRGGPLSRPPAGCALGSVGNPFDRVWPPTTSGLVIKHTHFWLPTTYLQVSSLALTPGEPTPYVCMYVSMVHTHMWYVRGYVLGEEGVNTSTSRGRNSKLEG